MSYHQDPHIKYSDVYCKDMLTQTQGKIDHTKHITVYILYIEYLFLGLERGHRRVIDETEMREVIMRHESPCTELFKRSQSRHGVNVKYLDDIL